MSAEVNADAVTIGCCVQGRRETFSRGLSLTALDVPLTVPLAVGAHMSLFGSFFGCFTCAPRSPDDHSLLPVSADDDGSSVHRERAAGWERDCRTVRSGAVGIFVNG